LGFNGTFSTNRLYREFEKYVAVKKTEINEKVDNVTWQNVGLAIERSRVRLSQKRC